MWKRTDGHSKQENVNIYYVLNCEILILFPQTVIKTETVIFFILLLSTFNQSKYSMVLASKYAPISHTSCLLPPTMQAAASPALACFVFFQISPTSVCFLSDWPGKSLKNQTCHSYSQKLPMVSLPYSLLLYRVPNILILHPHSSIRFVIGLEQLDKLFLDHFSHHFPF